MAVSKPIIQQRLPFVDAQGRLSNEGLRALNDALGALFDQINQIAELYNLTKALDTNLSGVAAAPVLLRSASSSFANGRVLVDGTAIGFITNPGSLTVYFDGTTDDVPEGLNRYFTIARARSSVSGSATVSYADSTGVFSLTDANVVAALGYTPAMSGTAQAVGIRAITASPTITAQDYTFLCDAAAAAFGVVLPAAATMNGRIFVFKKIDASANAVTITPTSSELIDGAASLVISGQYDSYTIQSNGSAWWVL